MKQTLAFFGATGGVTNTTLALALHAKHYCTALSRSPRKLVDMLRTNHAVPLETIEMYLSIHEGDVTDVDVVAAVLRSPKNGYGTDGGATHGAGVETLVDMIVFGIGSYPAFQWSLFQPITLQEPRVCEQGTRTIFEALERLAAKGVVSTAIAAAIAFPTVTAKPLMLSVSTTGISHKARDVPLLLAPLYHWVLHVPHEDKRKAEALLIHDDGRHIRDCVIVRPTLLTDAAPRGVQNVRVGWEWKNAEVEREGVTEPGPQMGWSVGRRDVGAFMFEKVVCEGGWEGRCVSLTY